MFNVEVYIVKSLKKLVLSEYQCSREIYINTIKMWEHSNTMYYENQLIIPPDHIMMKNNVKLTLKMISENNNVLTLKKMREDTKFFKENTINLLKEINNFTKEEEIDKLLDYVSIETKDEKILDLYDFISYGYDFFPFNHPVNIQRK